MPNINPRISVVLEEPLYRLVAKKAKRDRVSLSLLVRDIVKKTIEEEEEAYEDQNLVLWAESRKKTFTQSKALTHEEMWR